MSHNWSKLLKKVSFTTLVIPMVLGCSDKAEESDDHQSVDKQTKNADDRPGGLTPEQAAKVVAKVGDRTITVGEITRQINRLSPYIRRRWSAPEKRKEFLENMIRVELLSQEAERLGIGKDDPEVRRTVNQVLIRLMIKNDLEKELIPSEIPEDVLKQEYEKEKDKYQRPPQIRISQIVTSSKQAAEKLLADLQEHKKDSRYFREQARKLSIDETTKARGGDIGYFSRDAEGREDEPKIASAVREAAWKLQTVGDICDTPVQTDQGFHVIKLTNKRAELNRSFENVKKMIEGRLLRQKRRDALDAFVNDLEKKAKVEMFKENLAKIDLENVNSAMAPPGSPSTPSDTGKMNTKPMKPVATKTAQP